MVAFRNSGMIVRRAMRSEFANGLYSIPGSDVSHANSPRLRAPSARTRSGDLVKSDQTAPIFSLTASAVSKTRLAKRRDFRNWNTVSTESSSGPQGGRCRRAAGAAAPRWPGFRAPLNHTMRPSIPPSRNHPGPAIERPAHDVKRNRHRPDIAAATGPQAQARSDQRTSPPRFNPRTRLAFLP